MHVSNPLGACAKEADGCVCLGRLFSRCITRSATRRGGLLRVRPVAWLGSMALRIFELCRGPRDPLDKAFWHSSDLLSGGGRAHGYPPFGITGLGAPDHRRGRAVSRVGWWGLVATTAGLMGLVPRMWPAVPIVLIGFWAMSAATWDPPETTGGLGGASISSRSFARRDVSIARSP